MVGCSGSGGNSSTLASSASQSSTSSSGPTATSTPAPAPIHLRVERLRDLPAPISGEALARTDKGLLVIGGLNEAGASTDGVFRLDPKNGKATASGALAEPLHDLAAATLGGVTLAFGGGSASTVTSAQEIVPGGTSRVVGQLPQPSSDLSAIAIGSSAYVVGGYDGTEALAGVLETTDGSKFHRVADLPVPVRYTALAESGGTLYAFGGEQTDGADTRAIQAVDLATGRARITGKLPASLAHASAVELRGTIFILGGRESGSAGQDILAFDPATGKLSRAGRLPAPLTNAAAVTFSDAGYLVGGLDANTSAVASVLRLTPAP